MMVVRRDGWKNVLIGMYPSGLGAIQDWAKANDIVMRYIPGILFIDLPKRLAGFYTLAMPVV